MMHGLVDPVLLSCVVLGGTVGTRAGLWLLSKLSGRVLRIAFSVVLLAIGVQMWLKY